MRTARLEFDEYPDDHIVVRLSPVSLDDFDAIVDLFNVAGRQVLAKPIRALYAKWAPVALISWSFPEPATVAGLGARDPNLGLAIVRQWIEGVRHVPLPLPVPSSGTAQSDSPD